MKNSSNTIGNRTRDFQACSTVPQPTTRPRVPEYSSIGVNIRRLTDQEIYHLLWCLEFHYRVHKARH
jgi:hypothetical protein